MFVEYRGSIVGILGWQWKYVVFFTVAAAAAVFGGSLAPADWRGHFEVSALPIGVVGGAIGIFMSFRTNSAYDRWWEARKLWGALVNSSRHWATQVLAYLSQGTEPTPLQRELVRRHIGYVHVLRCLLRRQPIAEDPEVKDFFGPAEIERLSSSSNATHLLLHTQLLALQEEVRAGRLDLFHQQLLDATLRDLIEVQGGCERIKNTPFPRGYGYVGERLILVFSVVFPLGIADDMGWLAVPMSVLVCLAFLLIGEVGRVLEDPFTMFWPALPLSALSKTIEINLRERLGETGLPPLPKSNAKGILM